MNEYDYKREFQDILERIPGTNWYALVTLDGPIFQPRQTFTRSNGSVVSRLYERLTKASRRRTSPMDIYADTENEIEQAYRQGVYDAYKALQEELS